MRTRLLAGAALALAACSSAPRPKTVEAARKLDADAVAAASAQIDETPPQRFVVVQWGKIVASASLPDDAVRAAERDEKDALHRFVFRRADRGPKLYRMAYVAEGGVVAGRRFLSDLGLEVSVTPGKPPMLRKKGAAQWTDLAGSPRFDVAVATLDGAVRETFSAAFDPDFDGGLLLPADAAVRLALERYEIPGDAEVQVALGRPFAARRATVLVRVDLLHAAGPVEAVCRVPPSAAPR